MGRKHRRPRRRKSRRPLQTRREETLKVPPGTLHPDPTQPPPQIHLIAFSNEEFREEDLASADEIIPLRDAWPVLWIDVVGLGDAGIIARLGEIFGLHPLALEDVVNTHQRPKMDDYEDHLFFVCQMMNAADHLSSEQISLFLGKTFVITFQERAGDTFDPVRERLRKSRGRLRTSGADYLAYCLIDSIVDGYFPLLETLSDRIDEAEWEVSRSNDHRLMEDIHQLRSELLLIRRNVWHLRDALGAALREPHPLMTGQTRVFLRDCYDHTVQLIDLAEIYRELCGDLREYFLSLVGQRTNEIMKVLTIIATIFIPLGFIAGLYGMNFDPSVSPWNMPELKWRYGYPFALVLMLLVAVGLVFYFIRKGWLGRRWFFPPENGTGEDNAISEKTV